MFSKTTLNYIQTRIFMYILSTLTTMINLKQDFFLCERFPSSSLKEQKKFRRQLIKLI